MKRDPYQKNTIAMILERCTPEPNTGCLLWPGASSRGYAKARFNGGPRPVRLHRAVYEAKHGPLPDGVKVLHRCDQPPCLEERHLFAGTQAENVLDRDRKGRTAKGPKNGKWRGGVSL